MGLALEEMFSGKVEIKWDWLESWLVRKGTAFTKQQAKLRVEFRIAFSRQCPHQLWINKSFAVIPVFYKIVIAINTWSDYFLSCDSFKVRIWPSVKPTLNWFWRELFFLFCLCSPGKFIFVNDVISNLLKKDRKSNPENISEWTFLFTDLMKSHKNPFSSKIRKEIQSFFCEISGESFRTSSHHILPFSNHSHHWWRHQAKMCRRLCVLCIVRALLSLDGFH